MAFTSIVFHDGCSIFLHIAGLLESLMPSLESCIASLAIPATAPL